LAYSSKIYSALPYSTLPLTLLLNYKFRSREALHTLLFYFAEPYRLKFGNYTEFRMKTRFQRLETGDWSR
jgi:hypothetical protein